jgi:hypothetical protein
VPYFKILQTPSVVFQFSVSNFGERYHEWALKLVIKKGVITYLPIRQVKQNKPSLHLCFRHEL